MKPLPPRPNGARPWLVAIGAALAFSTLGCPGDLDPEVARNKLAGAGGSTGGGIGGGTGGSTSFCDAPGTLLMSRCALAGCHDANGVANADLDMSTAGLVGRLVGRMPTGMKNSMCGSAGKAYLVAGTDPAEGLLLDKLFLDQSAQPCGNKMPIGVSLNPTEEGCVRDWAKGVTTGGITP